MAAIDAIRAHLKSGDLQDGVVFDAVRVRLIEVSEAVKALPERLLATESALPWAQIAGMRDHLAHRYFDTSHAVVAATLSDDLPELENAVRHLLQVVDDDN
ncbi:MAG: HepT-like ribonuclease domain-containing protein [Candidatus Dormibacteria bacterium]